MFGSGIYSRVVIQQGAPSGTTTARKGRLQGNERRCSGHPITNSGCGAEQSASGRWMVISPQPKQHARRVTLTRTLLLPLFFATYSFAYLDRANYGFGAAAGMARTLGRSTRAEPPSRINSIPYAWQPRDCALDVSYHQPAHPAPRIVCRESAGIRAIAVARTAAFNSRASAVFLSNPLLSTRAMSDRHSPLSTA